MIRRLVLNALAFLFLFWLFWPRAWLPAAWRAREREAEARIADSMPGSLLAGGPERPAAAERSSVQAAVLVLPGAEDAFPAEAALRAAGIPYCVVGDTTAAFAHRIVIVPAGDRPLPARRELVDAVGRYVEEGGVLVVQAPSLAPWPDVTGVSSVKPSRARRSLVLRAGLDEGFAALTAPEQKEVPLAAPSAPEGPWTGGLVLRRGQAQAIALFPDGDEAAISRRRLGRGRAYVIGADLRDLVVRPRAGRAFDAGRAAGNAFEPGADVWPDVLRGWYEAFTPGWVRLRALPGDASGLLLLSRSIESGVSPAAAREWAAWESSRGLRATYFVQTNHSDGGQPGPFYDASLADAVRAVRAAGHEVAAHTVVHDPGFASLPRGDGLERRKTYRPATDAGRIWDATRLGEVRVPKEILEKDAGATVSGFRAPEGSEPDDLDAELASSGYGYDSSLAATTVLGHRPFLLPRGRGMEAESRIVELPMTVSDETPARAVPGPEDILRVLRAVFAEEGVAVWQVKPSREGLAAAARVLDGLPAGVRVGPLGEAARWWSARERVRFWTEEGPDGRVLRLVLPPEADGAELSFEASAPLRACRALAEGLDASCAGRLIVLRRTGGAREAALSFELEGDPRPRQRAGRAPSSRR